MNIKEVDVLELQEKMNSDKKPFLLDVREEHEYKFVNLNAKLIPLGQLPIRLAEIENYKNSEVIIHCRSGVRSLDACRILLEAGFTDVANLAGGILDWARKIDPDMPVY